MHDSNQHTEHTMTSGGNSHITTTHGYHTSDKFSHTLAIGTTINNTNDEDENDTTNKTHRTINDTIQHHTFQNTLGL